MLTITLTPYVKTETRREHGREYTEQIYLLKVFGTSPAVTAQLKIGDDEIDLCWHNSPLKAPPIRGTAYVELFTATEFYTTDLQRRTEEPGLQIIFYSPTPDESYRPKLIRDEYGVEYEADDDEVAVGAIDEQPMIERRVPYSQIMNRTIEVSLCGTGSGEGTQVVFQGNMQEVITHARAYDGIGFEEQSYMVE